MNLDRTTGKHLAGLGLLSIALFSTLWDVAEKLSLGWGRPVHLSFYFPPLDLGFLILTVTLNPGSVLGVLVGVFLFWIL
ncbi:MAG: hypothetical protein HKM06_07980 [Spirochaetales bacterium]|nr:hypothetical protein [Spirochaetales bacterium]